MKRTFQPSRVKENLPRVSHTHGYKGWTTSPLPPSHERAKAVGGLSEWKVRHRLAFRRLRSEANS